MSDNNKLPYLRLIDPTDTDMLNDSRASSLYKDQISLFSDADAETLGFVEASAMKATSFLRMLEDVSPKYIFDLRKVPNFSNGELTRRAVFAMFKELSIEYFDIAGYLRIKSTRDTSLNPKLLIPNVLENLIPSKKGLLGPILFFVDSDLLREEYINEIAKELPNQNLKGWNVNVWRDAPAIDEKVNDRSLVFISHANPQDNDIAKWFATRLAAEGFNVWSDVTRLTGGEVFWDTIEEVIRHKTAKFVILLSNEGHQKPGVLDEVNLAISTERSIGLDSFVLPVRIDDLPFSSIRANLARKNIIDGSRELRSALLEVIEALESSGVKRDLAVNDRQIKTLCEIPNLKKEKTYYQQWSKLYQNRIQIDSFPTAIHKFTGMNPPLMFRKSEDFLSIGTCQNGVLTFGKLDEVSNALKSSVNIQKGGSCVSEGIFNGDASDLLGVSRGDLKRSLSAIIKSSWDETCRQKGMLQYHLSNRRRCWFFPLGHFENDKVKYSDHAGKIRSKSLVGRSEKRNVYWHFAIEAQVQVNDQSIRLKPHVVFTEDGQIPISSVARQHSLRRGFCRSWWNDRWRDLLDAMLQTLAAGKENWNLIASPSQSITVSGSLTSLDLSEESETIGIIEEPPVQVGYSQEMTDARKGLMLFGPVDFDRNPSEIRLGVIGTTEGISLFTKWCEEFRKPTELTEKQIEKNEVPFPGFEAIFEASWPTKPKVAVPLSKNDLISAIRIKDRHQAVYDAVDMYVSGIQKALNEDDPQVDIWFIVIPDDVYQYGRPNSKVPTAVSLEPTVFMSKKAAKAFGGNAPSLFEEDNEAAKIYQHHANFHHQLKARLLGDKVVTQIFRESSIVSSLDPNFVEFDEDEVDDGILEDVAMNKTRRMQAPSNVAWNLSTASFFKSGGRPWKVSTARPGVCYLGLIFKKDEFGISGNACCGAQLFLDSGEGMVFKGSKGNWYSNKTKQYHLDRNEAKNLMSRALETYKGEHSIYPSEIFVHGRTRFNEDELSGFSAACEGKSEITGVRITRTSDFKLYSTGDLAVKRGTYQLLTDRLGLLWTSGYVEELGTYQGRETPNPLRVEICGNTTSNIKTVLKDILTLTKMNFNSAVYADGYPVTMRFADAIGDVLMAASDKDVSPLPFRHYI